MELLALRESVSEAVRLGEVLSEALTLTLAVMLPDSVGESVTLAEMEGVPSQMHTPLAVEPQATRQQRLVHCE